jgi:endonuclease-8
MPEGDSIAKTAARLRPHLVGATVEGLFLRERGDVPSLRGSKVTAIDTHGKHMLIRLEPDWVLRVHLGMHGRWRMVRAQPPQRYPRSQASVVLATASGVAICTRAMAAALRHADDPGLRRILRSLGPDLLAEEFDLDEVVRRARSEAFEDRPIAELLLDQRVAAGIGNVYKSEALFLVGVHPQARVRRVTDEQLRELYAVCRRLMRLNLLPGLRTTTARAAVGVRRPPSVSRHWVYRRRALPCFRCKEPIERTLVGEQARSTYWCPGCQPVPG